MRRHLVPALTIATLLPIPLLSGPILYGGLGGHPPSIDDGSIVIVNQTTAAISVVGQPDNVARISGLAFGLNGSLYVATQAGGGFPPPPGPSSFSNLIQIDPGTGAQVTSVPIMDAAGAPISIADLAVQPGTGVLYGITSPLPPRGVPGELYTIDPVTGAADLKGNTNFFFASIAFAPDGTLYMSSANLGPMGIDVDMGLRMINPANAAILSTVAADFYGALGVRPTDGLIFATNGDGAQLFTVDPATGSATLVGSTGLHYVGDLDFQPVPEPGTPLLFAAGIAAMGLALRRKKR